MNDIYLITSAAAFAAEAHKNQVRKELNEPYIIHPARVAKMAAQLKLPAQYIAAAYLHDVLEDTNTPKETLQTLFPGRTYELTFALTKWWEDGHPSQVQIANKQAYYTEIIRVGAVTLKILDRVDNLYDFAKMARMSPSNHAWAGRYLTKTQSEFQRLLDACPSGQAIKWFNTAMDTLSDAVGATE
jgi:(p)ppGpp synthase/HD superfamily hydrolase